MKFNHCKLNFRPYKVCFLHNYNGFTNRKLFIAVCPVCSKTFIRLEETRIKDGMFFVQYETGARADQLYEKLKLQTEYTDIDVKISKGKPCGWIYGENREIHNKKGEIIAIKQVACDWFGQKDVIAKILVE